MMGCGCRKNRSTVTTTMTTSNPTGYQVYRNGTYTGRQFSSLAAAQSFAQRIDGEVRSI